MINRMHSILTDVVFLRGENVEKIFFSWIFTWNNHFSSV